MIALLIHFLGGLLVDSAIPAGIGSADAYFLSWWYAAFAAVDLAALCFARARLRLILALSFAWSCALVIEQLLFQDGLQSNDWLVQRIIDGMLCLYFGPAIRLRFKRKSAEKASK